jgi:hypothetical protein
VLQLVNVRGQKLVRARNVRALAVVGQQLHDEPYLEFPEQRLDRSHDSGLTADLDAIADLERLLVIQMARRHHLVATPKLIAIVDPSHRQSGRYAPRAPTPCLGAIANGAQARRRAGCMAAGDRPHPMT